MSEIDLLQIGFYLALAGAFVTGWALVAAIKGLTK